MGFSVFRLGWPSQLAGIRKTPVMLFFLVLNCFTNHSGPHFHIQTPKQVALHSQNREAAPVPTTDITAPPETGKEGLKDTWAMAPGA